MFKAMFSAIAFSLLISNAAFASGQQAVDENTEQRTALVERAIATAEAAVANPAFLDTAEWAAFKSSIRETAQQPQDGRSFRQAFNQAAEQLPFTHFQLHSTKSSKGEAEGAPNVSLSWPRNDVALLNIRMFAGAPSVITEAMDEVIKRQAQTLIVDLRGTPGGSFPTAVALSNKLRWEAIDAGAFMTRKWFMQHGDYPTAEQYPNIAALEVLDLEAFAAQLQRDGAARLVIPAHEQPVFEGQVMVLTDGATGSTCEPLVYMLKQQGAMVIGERTFGGMLSAQYFPMDEHNKLFVPVADYVTPDLLRLDRRGVAPTVQVLSSEALDHALEIANGNSQTSHLANH
jgi:carboxyl-terminal processing protease